MPIGAMIVRETVDKWRNGAHGSTFGGNPVCCAAALATLDVVEQSAMANAAVQGSGCWRGQRADGQTCVHRRRARRGADGRRGVREGPRDARADGILVQRIVELAFERGLLLLGAGRARCGWRRRW